MHSVLFISIEAQHPDMIVSFALAPSGMKSLTLLRTPEYEPILDESERGVSVGYGSSGSIERNLLVSIEWVDDKVSIDSLQARYVLDVSRVDGEDIEAAKQMLHAMNFDHRFRIHAA